MAAAGTGGHIYPGLALAEYFQKNEFKVSWLGTPDGMENHLVDKNKIQFSPIWMQGVRGKGVLRWLKLPLLLTYATIQAFIAIRKLNPSIVLVMGGYISVPVAIAAKIMRIHLIIHEQNALVGLSNRVISMIANVSFSGFKTNVKNMKVIGNPIREEIYKTKEPLGRFYARKGSLRILVLGGSLGAQQLNNYLPKIFEIVNKTKRITVIHQSGSKHYNDLINNYKKLNVEVDIIDIIHDMDKKYEWADLIIARSGALTVTEICEVGIASILIPYPYAVDNHQLFNAKIIEEKKGGYIIKQESMENDLMSLLIKITRKECLNMATNIRSKKRQNASQEILKHCMKVLAHEK